MKKTLIALAVLAASGASMAQVTLYGAVSTAYKNQKATAVVAGVGTDTRADGFTNGEVTGSDRWGIRGTEDLGGGLKATFQLESTLNTRDGETPTATASGNAAATATGFTRQSTVGLEGSFGAVRFGRSITPIFVLIDATDVNGTQGISTVNLNGGLQSRAANAVFYATPNTFGGFYANAMYGTNDVGTSAANGANLVSNQGLSLGYKSGPLHVAAAMGVVNTSGLVAAVLQDGKTDGQALGLTYDFGPASVFFNTIKQKTQANSGIDTKTENGETNVGISVPVGAITLQGALGRNTRTETVGGVEAANTATSGTGNGNDWTLGALYSLSKRTTAFVKTGVFNKIDFGGVTTNRIETTATAIGLRHTF